MIIQDFEKHEKWKTAFDSPGLQSPQSTHRLRNTVAQRTRLSCWYRLKWLFKWSFWVFCNHRNKKLKHEV